MVDFIFSRMRNGWAILMQALCLIHEHKAFYWFALLRMVCGGVFIFIVLFQLVLQFLGNFTVSESHKVVTPEGTVMQHTLAYKGENPELTMLSLFGILLLGMLLPMILESAITLYTNAMLHKRSMSAGQLFRDTGKTLWHVFCWMIFNFTVGILIRIIAGNRNKNEFSIVSFIRELIGWLLATAWAVTTFLVPQVIALEGQGVIGSIKGSFNLLKKTFGESIAANFLFDIFSSACWLIVAGIISASLHLHLMAQSLQFPFITVLLCLPFVYLSSLINVAKTIFKTSIYCYAKNSEKLGFDDKLIQNSFK